jgi:hypothetical protein
MVCSRIKCFLAVQNHGVEGLNFAQYCCVFCLKTNLSLRWQKYSVFCRKDSIAVLLIWQIFDWQARMDRNTTITNLKTTANTAADAICLFPAKTKKRK